VQRRVNVVAIVIVTIALLLPVSPIINGNDPRRSSRLQDLIADTDTSSGRKIVADLKLGPLPKQSTVKVTVVLSELLKEELDAYAAEHSRLYEPVETAALIPHMLEAFLRTDRAWCSYRKQVGQGQTGRRRGRSTSAAHE
jgi:hypothetical protein